MGNIARWVYSTTTAKLETARYAGDGEAISSVSSPFVAAVYLEDGECSQMSVFHPHRKIRDRPIRG
jgi:hypothetical protein